MAGKSFNKLISEVLNEPTFKPDDSKKRALEILSRYDINLTPEDLKNLSFQQLQNLANAYHPNNGGNIKDYKNILSALDSLNFNKCPKCGHYFDALVANYCSKCGNKLKKHTSLFK